MNTARVLAMMLLSVLSLSFAVAGRAADIHHEDVASGKLTREFYLVTPGHKPDAPMPLVLVLHGHGGTAANTLGQEGVESPLAAWIPIADREQVIVASLQGAKGNDGHPGWNDCRADAPGNTTTDDVQFARDVIMDLQKRKLIDRKRIYVMGMSNGAMMAQRLALELDPPIAAFAAVSGSMAVHSVCKPATHPVSALLIHGTADPLVPYGGGDVHFFKQKRGAVLSVANTVQFWLKADHLTSATPVETPLAHRALTANPTLAKRQLYGAKPTSPQVELITITGGGHVEPSLEHHYGALYALIVGKQNADFESAEEAWSFFKDKKSP